MVYYKLNDNVYLVSGALRHCIYNLNDYKLYHINNNYKTLILKLHAGIDQDNTSTFDSAALNLLLQNGIIINTDESSDLLTINDLVTDIKIDFAWIEVTNTCNLKCVHCYNSSHYNNNSEHISKTNFFRAIDQLESTGIKKIQLIGGEPFCLGDNILDLLRYCLNKFEFIEIFSNLTNISDSIIQFLSINNINIATSIYSYDSANHDAVTKVNGSHAMTVSNLNKIIQHNITQRVSSVKLRDIFIGTRSKLCTYSIDNKQDSVRMCGRANKELIDLKHLEYNVINKDTFKKPLNRNRVIRCVSGHNCFSSKIYIDKELNLYPCVMERRISHGNISAKSINDCLKHDILTLNKSHINECSNCEFRYTCFDCRPNSLGYSVLDKPWYCLYKPTSGTWGEFQDLVDKHFD